MESYKHEVSLRTMDVKVGDLRDILERCREIGSAELSYESEVPGSLFIGYEVGPGGSAADLWDLHDAIAELSANLEGFGIDLVGLGKPDRQAP